MARYKTFDSTGIAPNGRLYAGDLNGLQDAQAGLYDLTQHLGAADIAIGEAGLMIVRYGAGEARVTGGLRTDGILRGNGGLLPGYMTTTARNALASGHRPQGMLIWNTTTNRLEINNGDDTTPDWQPVLGRKIMGAVDDSGSVVRGTGFTPSRTGTGVYSVTYTNDFPTGTVPTVLAVVSGTTSEGRLSISGEDDHHFIVHTYAGGDNPPALADRGFNFSALETITTI